jgi:Trypsin
VLGNATCSLWPDFNGSSELCAGVPGRGICSGDSGGPLVTTHSALGPVQIGIASWSPAAAAADVCADDVPSFFVRIGSIVPAIVGWMSQDPAAPVRPPTAQTGLPSPPSETSATVSGSVVPNGLATAYRFDYGTSTNYGKSVGGYAGSSSAPVAVQQQLSGLRPGTTYHYRLVAISAAGTVAGADQTFKTAGQARVDAYTHAFPSRGIAGRIVSLRYGMIIGDERIKTQERIQVRLRRVVVARFSTVFAPNPRYRTTVEWRAPARFAGKRLIFCVSTHVKGGPWSAWSCAYLRLR